MNTSNIEIYYDGLNFSKYAHNKIVSGFTTNCTLFASSSFKNYSLFFLENKKYLNDRPISFQIWEDDTSNAIKQIDNIHNIDPKIFVKIPIINTNGIYNESLLEYITSNSIPVNVTCIYTLNQIETAFKLLNKTTSPIIISIFAGPISDIGIDPSPFINYAISLFRNMNNVKILWAGCREPYTIVRASQLGCHIITIPDTILDKILISTTLEQLSIDRAKIFKNGALNSNISI
jgi:transaldolase